MRISLGLLFILSIGLQTACGDFTERHHIDESIIKRNQPVRNNGPFHSLSGWPSPVSYYVEAKVPDRIIEASIAAADSWNDAVGYVVLDFVGIMESERGNELYSSLNDDLTLIYYEENWLNTTGKAVSTLATTVWENDRNTGSILRGDIILNAEVYLFQDSTAPALDETRKNYIVDSETVILHEFGHLLGLDHIDEAKDAYSVMHAKTFIGPYMHSRELSDGDRFNIRSIYN